MVRNIYNSNTKGNKAKRNYSQVFAIIREINNYGVAITYKELLLDFTNKRTDSLSSLSDKELAAFIDSLMAMKKETVPTAIDYKTDARNPIRRAIIAQFKSIGSTVEGAKEWAEKYGVQGNKRKFNDYSAQELYILLQNSKKLTTNFKKGLNKSFNG